MISIRFVFAVFVSIILVSFSGGPARCQVGQGLFDANTASAEELASLPHMTPALVEQVREERPFTSIVDLNRFLVEAGLTSDQVGEFYGEAFVHVNLNTATEQEFLLIPGTGRRMAHEFDEYRPWKSWAQFDREIGKYVDKGEAERLKQYLFIPVDLNTATDEEIGSIPGVGRRMVHEFKEYRPWRAKEQFEREIGKYVDSKEVARLWRYVVIP